jgi:hypothetical protein
MMDKHSRLVRAVDFQEEWLQERAYELDEPVRLHRKLWEFAVIVQIAQQQFNPLQCRVLGFGVGHEPLASWFAARGSQVLATDRPDKTKEWTATGQHALDREACFFPRIVTRSVFDEAVTFRPVDMTRIPQDLQTGTYDLLWSCGSLEHLGGFKAGIKFICEAMSCLRPGGFAVHTTEYQVDGPITPLEHKTLCLYRAPELVDLERSLQQQGDSLWPYDLQLGTTTADHTVAEMVDSMPHLQVKIGSWVTTSLLLVAQRGNDGKD